MPISHETMVWIAKTFGLLYLIALSIIVLGYAYWPSKRKEFEEAPVTILNKEDRPWQ
ncbi:cbb3-type cytochrome c oxidase subunit 3 [Sinorhizobium sp. 6-70]|nr:MULTISPECIES: cbb3-type cytochrome c oxidase subunit 3 [unclassified Sinorhizobium]MDK1378687.1 cbb3-type cytochrome c oxidase subunit 3 [Sinorhizobium sp. 6-70]MDK1480755.1 cbb3-type cytochrome c oxidase subunit 3 [Sinorhizobium sp. 6-117]